MNKKRKLMKRSGLQYMAATARRVMTMVLMTGLCTSASGQLVQNYLTSKDDFIHDTTVKTLNNNTETRIVNGNSNLVKWDDNENAVWFPGGRGDENRPFLFINDEPFSKVTAGSGLSISMDFKIYQSAHTSASGYTGKGTGSYARLIDVNNNATKGQFVESSQAMFNFTVGGNKDGGGWVNAEPTTTMAKFSTSTDDARYKRFKNQSDVNAIWTDSWHHLTIVMAPSAIPVIYIDGREIDTNLTDASQNTKTLSESTTIFNGLLNSIGQFKNVFLGRSGYNSANSATSDGYLCGYIRNVQIIQSGNVKQLYLRSGASLSNGKITAKVDGSSSGQNVTSSGIIMSSGVDIVLTAVPNTGYYMSELFLDKTTGATTSVLTGAATDAPGEKSYTLTNFDDNYYTFATFAEREYTVAYDQNSYMTVGGVTTTEEVTGMPTATSMKYKYFSDAFTFPSETPVRKGYTFLGWSTNKDATTATYTAGSTVADNTTSDPTSAKGVLSSAVSDQNVLTLYAVWQKVNYNLNINVITQDYTGAQTDSKTGTNSVTGTGGTVTLARALQISPDTWTASNTVAQYKDLVKITTTNATDYHLQELRYSYTDGTEQTVNITDWNGYSSVIKSFTMNHAAPTTVIAVFKHNQQYNITSTISGTGSVSYRVKHNGTEGSAVASTANPQAMENDEVKVIATATSAYKLRSIEYTFASETGRHSLFNGKADTYTTSALRMLGQNVTVDAIFLANRTVTVGGKTERGTITMTGTYGTSSGDVTTSPTAGNAALTAHLGDVVTVTATPTAGWHFDTSKAIAELFPLTNGGTPTEVTRTLESASMTFSMPDNDVTVAGAFTENQYTIRYDAQGGSTVDSQTKKHFESLALSTTVPTKADCTFMGWAKSETDAQNKKIAYSSGATAGSELNGVHHQDVVTLYAVWKNTEYSVDVYPGINGGQVSVNTTTAEKNATVTVSCTAYEGYSNPKLYYYQDNEEKTAHVIVNSAFQMPSGNVHVYATFGGTYDARKEGVGTSTPPTIEHGDITIGGVSITAIERPKVGSRVNTVANPEDNYRLKQIRWRKVTDAGVMRTRSAGETDVEVEGWNTLTYDGTNVTYSTETGEYVARITGVDSDIYMDGEFQQKIPLQNTSASSEGYVTLIGPGAQQYTGSAITPASGSYSVTFHNGTANIPQTEGSEYTIEWSNNTAVGKASAKITAAATNELFTGSVTLNDVFDIIQVPTGDYSADYSPNFTYDGSAKTLTDLKVYKEVSGDKSEVTAGSGAGEYSVAYENNVNAGTATCKITINGDGGGTLIRNFNIKPKPITVTAKTQTVAYGESIVTAASQATAATLVDSHSLVSANFAQTHKDVGTHTGDIEVTGAKIKDGSGNDMTSNYDITYVKGDLTITQKALTITPIARTLEYGDALPTGENALTALYTVDGLAYGESLTAGPTGYSVKQGSTTVTLQQGTAAGAYKLTLSGATASTNYTIAYAEGDLTITQYDLTQATVEVTGAEQGYDGVNAKTPESVAVKKHIEGDTYWTLPATDYDVKYAGEASQTNPGTYTITAVAKSTNVTGTATAETPLVIGKYDLSGGKVTATIIDQTYTGSQLRPTTFSALKMDNGTGGGMALDAADYEIISYGQNVNVGSGTLTIRAKDASAYFKGDRTVTFNIVAADLSSQTASVAYADYVMAGSSTDTHQLKLNGRKTEVSTTLINGQTVSLASNSLVVKLKLPGGSANTTALSPDDYDVYFQKDTEDPIASIPANAIGVYKVVVKGKTNTTTETTNTTSYSVTTDLTVNVKLAVTLANRTWTTYYDERFSLKLPTGFKAYYVTGITAATSTTDATVNLSAEMDHVPQGVPVLLERPDGNTDTTFELEEETSPAVVSENYASFVGVPSTGVMPAGVPTYILMNNAFVGCETGTDIGAHRAFLTTPAVVGGARLLLNIGDDATALIPTEDVGGKTEDVWYDLMGNRINKPTRKGLYIRNGEKVIVK